MLTKFILRIDNEDYELQPDDLFNWADIQCSYSRAEYGGVIRSFMSKFEFINEAYQRLLTLYDQKGFNATASLTLYIINDSWTYDRCFSCDLDFTTLSYNGNVLSINAVDNSIAARIKANKGTKYEFELGEDIEVNGMQYRFDRLKILECATYTISGGESQDDGSLFGTYEPSQGYRLYTGLTNSEVSVGGAMMYNDDQEDTPEGFLIQARKDIKVKCEWLIDVNKIKGSAELILVKYRGVMTEVLASLAPAVKANPPIFFQDFDSIDEVKALIDNNPGYSHDWAYGEFSGWVSVRGEVWMAETDMMLGTKRWIDTGVSRDDFTSMAESGSCEFNLRSGEKVCIWFASDETREYGYKKSEIKFTWENRGDAVMIDSVSPQTLVERLLWRMGADCDCIISEKDPRLANVLLLPAESIRQLDKPKIYASFNDFCNWMETVFGYTYTIDDENNILEFRHRSEIFSAIAPVVDIYDVKDLDYSINKDVLYSSVEAGYNKQDYEGVNGRDEFNFSNSYTTTFPISGKKLELKSAFRADSYGLEFLAQKRGQDTTDNQSDNTIFFVSGIDAGNVYIPDRSHQIDGSITGTLINGEFSPVNCIHANREYISLMADSMNLEFASSEGNTDIVVDGFGMSENIELSDCEMLSAGILKFTIAEAVIPDDLNSLIRVHSDGYVYEGFIKDVTMKYAREESVEYQLYVKTKYQC